jgi:hypothetical protein
MLWQGLSLLPFAAILGVWCIILQLQLMGNSTPKSNKVPCSFAAMLLFAGVCLAIAGAFDEPAVMPSMPEVGRPAGQPRWRHARAARSGGRLIARVETNPLPDALYIEYPAELAAHTAPTVPQEVRKPSLRRF